MHCIDTLRYIPQDEVVRVGARGMWDADSKDVEAGAALTLEFSRGTLGVVWFARAPTIVPRSNSIGERAACCGRMTES